MAQDTAQDIGSILSGVGGSNGIGDDVGNVICALKGNCAPTTVNYVNPATTSSSSSMIWIIAGVGIIVLLVLVLKK